MLSLSTILATLGLTKTAVAAGTATLYNSYNCDEGVRGPTCYNLPELRCCISANGVRQTHFPKFLKHVAHPLFHSTTTKAAEEARTAVGSTCLDTGYRDIYGAFWFSCTRTCSVAEALGVADNTTIAAEQARVDRPAVQCEGYQLADAYHIAFPGQRQKPYSAAVVQKLMDADVVDWPTGSFKEDKIVEAIAILEVTGDGLTDAEKAMLHED
ncbi:hypothetical protein G7Y89_g3822 [Cudoniella acicularis]|uniref:Uncharacterized protein n=1 Tax=Cudoniella acicularis TaxID=354080 RepID=A0A8H4RQN2_9HELO|nr:hypothetical protein G7Y89_g3822 [Cudoniella acicularis]